MLRQEELAVAVGTHHELVDGGELTLPPGHPEREAETLLANESALLAMAERLGGRVVDAVEFGRFQLVYGADCSTLLGTIPALREPGRVGLMFVDGHEDTMPLDVSEDGEAANAEVCPLFRDGRTPAARLPGRARLRPVAHSRFG